jgi:hypothetical protein
MFYFPTKWKKREEQVLPGNEGGQRIGRGQWHGGRNGTNNVCRYE